MPAASTCAGTVVDTLPPLNARVADVYVPLDNVTVPVGVALLAPPVRFTVTCNN
jgi:dolichol kinase